MEGKTESASRACPAEPLTGVPVRAHGLAPARHASKGGFISDLEAVLKHMIMQQLTASCASLPTPCPIMSEPHRSCACRADSRAQTLRSIPGNDSGGHNRPSCSPAMAAASVGAAAVRWQARRGGRRQRLAAQEALAALERAVGPSAPQAELYSELASELVKDWAWGQESALGLQRLCHQSYKDHEKCSRGSG